MLPRAMAGEGGQGSLQGGSSHPEQEKPGHLQHGWKVNQSSGGLISLLVHSREHSLPLS